MEVQKDLTTGNPSRTLVSFAIPFFIANLLQALYGMVDLLIVGRFTSGPIDSAAVANGTQVLMLATFFLTGLTTGATVVIGNYFGAKDSDKLRKAIGTMLSGFCLFTLLLMAFLFYFTPALVRFLNTPAQAVEKTVEYVEICTAGLLFVYGYNAFSAILRGVGNSFLPMVFIGIACVCNIVIDLILVGGYGMGPAGAAYATIGSQAISMMCAFGYLKYQKTLFDFKLASLKIDPRTAWTLFSIGFPLAIQSTIIDLSFMLIFAFVNKFGVAASAGYGICCRLNGILLLPAVSLAMALTPIIAQNLGAGKHDRALRFLKLSATYATAVGVLLFCWMQFFPEPAFALFTNDPEVIRQGALYMRGFCYDALVLGFVFSGNGFLNGSGHTRFSLVNNLIPTFLVRVPFAWYISTMPEATLYGIGLAAPLASFLSIFITLTYLATGRWKLSRI
ncbi:MAG: MATE family efflux transporter [Planctomycetia bacterium]|nr:MATE family efflux transporter [Planctomycetia bacterium]